VREEVCRASGAETVMEKGAPPSQRLRVFPPCQKGVPKHL